MIFSSNSEKKEMIVGFIQKSFLDEKNKDDQNPDCMEYWMKLCEYYSSYMERVEDQSPRDSAHLSDFDVDFNKTQNLKEFISDIIFLFEKMLECINEVLREATEGENGEDGIEPEIYNITQKNQESIPIIIRYYKDLLNFSEGKSFDEINEFATYSSNNMNFNQEMSEAMQHFQSFLEIFYEKINEQNEFVSEWADDVSDNIVNLKDNLIINEISKNFSNISTEISKNIKNFTKLLQNLNELPKSINSIQSKLDLYITIKQSNEILDNLNEKIKEMNEMKENILKILEKRNQKLEGCQELDDKYNQICIDIREKFSNDPVEWSKENVKNAELITAFTYGSHKSLYKSIDKSIKNCEFYLPILNDIYKTYEKAREIINLQ